MGEDLIRVAIVDDDAGMRLVMRKIIERQPGYELVGRSRTGRNCWTRWDELEPECACWTWRCRA